jgi:hypothetical protein
MLFFFNNVPDSIETGIDKIQKLVKSFLRESNIPEKAWDGDKINVKQQFPDWILDAYNTSNSDAPVVDFFIFYYRWLFDLEDGYGLGFYLESLRDPVKIPNDFLQGYADYVFYDQLDFEEYPELLDNFRGFLFNYQKYYVPIRGTPDGLAYVLKGLFGVTSLNVITTSGGRITIQSDLDSTYQELFKKIACPYSFEITFIAA